MAADARRVVALKHPDPVPRARATAFFASPSDMRRLLPLLPALLLGASAAGCSSHERPAPPVAEPVIDGDQIRLPVGSPQGAVLVSAEARSQQSESVRLQGRLGWDETRTARIDAPVAGRIVRLLAAPGDVVTAGHALAQIASPEIGQAQADARRAEIDYEAATRSLARIRELHEAGITPTRELQAAEAEFERTAAEHQRTRARSASYGVGGPIDQLFPLRTPVPGIVVERAAAPGLEVRPDQAQPGQPALFVVSDPTRLWAWIDVPEGLVGAVRPGQTVSLKTAALPDRTIPARIAHVSDFIDPATRTLKARAEVDNADRALKAEMFISGELAMPVREAVLVPSTAVYLLGERYYAFVDLGEGRYRRREVQAEEAALGAMRILSGLKPGERVVTSGALLLQQLLGSGR